MNDDLEMFDDDSDVIRHPVSLEPNEYDPLEGAVPIEDLPVHRPVAAPPGSAKQIVDIPTIIPETDPDYAAVQQNNIQDIDKNGLRTVNGSYEPDNSGTLMEDISPREHVVKFDGDTSKPKYKKKFPIGLVIIVLILIGVGAFGISYLMNDNNSKDDDDDTTTEEVASSRKNTSSTEETDETTETTESTTTQTTTKDIYSVQVEAINYNNSNPEGFKIYCGKLKNNKKYQCSSSASDFDESTLNSYNCRNAGCAYFDISEDGSNLIIYDGKYISYNFTTNNQQDLNIPQINYKYITPYTNENSLYGLKLTPANISGVGYFDVSSQQLTIAFQEYADIESDSYLARYGYAKVYDANGDLVGLHSSSTRSLVKDKKNNNEILKDFVEIGYKDQLYFVVGTLNKPAYKTIDNYIVNGETLYNSSFSEITDSEDKMSITGYAFYEYDSNISTENTHKSLIIFNDTKYKVLSKLINSDVDNYGSQDYSKIFGIDSKYYYVYKDNSVKIYSYDRTLASNKKYVTGAGIELENYESYHIKTYYDKNDTIPDLFLYILPTPCEELSDSELLNKYANGTSEADGGLKVAKTNCANEYKNQKVKGIYLSYNQSNFNKIEKEVTLSSLSS